jgi:hypothetical protein
MTTRSVRSFVLYSTGPLSHVVHSYVRHVWKKLLPARLRVGIHDRAHNTTTPRTFALDADPIFFRCSRSLKSTAVTLHSIGRGKHALCACSSHHKQLIMAPISGKGLGGSSGINFYVFTQPPASDIDGMAALAYSLRTVTNRATLW